MRRMLTNGARTRCTSIVAAVFFLPPSYDSDAGTDIA